MTNLKNRVKYLLTFVVILILSYILINRITANTPEYTFWKIDVPKNEDFTRITIPDIGMIVTISKSGSILQSKDNGDSWTTIISQDGYSLKGLFFYNRSIGWCVGSNGIVLKTTNGGESWDSSFSGNSNYIFNSVWFLDELNGYLAGQNNKSGILMKTVDGGETWSEIKISSGEVSDIVFDMENTGFSVTSDGLITKTDVEDTWHNLMKFSELKFDKYFPVALSKSFMSGSENGLYLSNDKGITWILIQDTSPYKINDVYFIDEKNGWAVGDEGVFLYTSDGGDSWFRLETGTLSNFNAVSFTDKAFGFICGESGIVIKVILEQ